MNGLGSHRTLLSQAKPATGSWPQPRTGYQARQQNRNQHRSLREEPRLREGNRTWEQGGRFCHVKAGRASEPRILAGRDLNLRFLRPGETLGAEGKAELQEVTCGAALPRDDAGPVWVGLPTQLKGPHLGEPVSGQAGPRWPQGARAWSIMFLFLGFFPLNKVSVEWFIDWLLGA